MGTRELSATIPVGARSHADVVLLMIDAVNADPVAAASVLASRATLRGLRRYARTVGGACNETIDISIPIVTQRKTA